MLLLVKPQEFLGGRLCLQSADIHFCRNMKADFGCWNKIARCKKSVKEKKSDGLSDLVRKFWIMPTIQSCTLKKLWWFWSAWWLVTFLTDATETRNLSFTVMNLEDPTTWNSVLYLALGLVLVNGVILSLNVTWWHILTLAYFLAICDGGCGYGGRCIAPNQCQCAYGFAGPRCATGLFIIFSTKSITLLVFIN